MPIEARNLIKSFGSPATEVLKDISLRIEDGEFVSISGRSGCGKSTLLYILSSLDLPSSGTVSIDGLKLETASSSELHRFRNLNMGFVFQFHNLLPELNALENILMPALKAGRGEERRAFATELLREFDLSDKKNHLPSQLSGGEQQRVAIARALVMEPKYLFADEPTGNLDSANGNTVMRLFQRINRERKMAMIFVTHDAEFARLALRQIRMADGRLVD